MPTEWRSEERRHSRTSLRLGEKKAFRTSSSVIAMLR